MLWINADRVGAVWLMRKDERELLSMRRSDEERVFINVSRETGMENNISYKSACFSLVFVSPGLTGLAVVARSDAQQSISVM